MSIVGKNINNANTPGYSRQQVALQSGPFGGSVQLGSVMSVRHSSIQQALRATHQGIGYQQGRIHALSLAEPHLNDLNGGGISLAMDNFFLAASELSGNAAGTGERENLLANAQSMVTAFKSAANGLSQAKEAAELEAQLIVSQVNQLAKDIAQLNEQIASLQGSSQAGGELVDQRDVLLQQVATELGAYTVDGKGGSVHVFLPGGQKLVDGNSAATLKLTGSGDDPLQLSIQSEGGSPLGVSGVSGKLGGLFEARDVTLKSAQGQLDQVAFALISEVNALHEQGYGTDGSTGNSFFKPLADAQGAAAAMAISADVAGKPEKIAASVDPDMLPGDEGNIGAILALQQEALLPGGKTLAEGYDGVVFTVSTALHDAQGRLDVGVQRFGALEEIRASESGVSLHEEMMALSQAERAFEAASRMVATADEMYDTLMRMV